MKTIKTLEYLEIYYGPLSLSLGDYKKDYVINNHLFAILKEQQDDAPTQHFIQSITNALSFHTFPRHLTIIPANKFRSLKKFFFKTINYESTFPPASIANMTEGAACVPLNGNFKRFGHYTIVDILMCVELISEHDPFIANHIANYGNPVQSQTSIYHLPIRNSQN